MTVTLAPLPYALDALEPHMSRAALEAHHGHHHATYVQQVPELIRGSALASAPLDQIVRAGARRTRKALYHAAAQAWNHAFFWQCMRPNGGGEPSGRNTGIRQLLSFQLSFPSRWLLLLLQSISPLSSSTTRFAILFLVTILWNRM